MNEKDQIKVFDDFGEMLNEGVWTDVEIMAGKVHKSILSGINKHLLRNLYGILCCSLVWL